MLKLIKQNSRNIMLGRNPKLCAAVHSNWRKPRPNVDVTDAKFFPEYFVTLKDKEGKIIIGNREVNYPDILQKEQPPYYLSPSCNARVKATLTSKPTPQGTKIIHENGFKLTSIFEIINHRVINILMIHESKIRKRHYWLIFKLP